MSFALVQPLDAPTGSKTKVDKDLDFIRLRSRKQSESEFISVKSIIRGALLVEDRRRLGDFLVVDTVDGDWFLRGMQM